MISPYFATVKMLGSPLNIILLYIEYNTLVLVGVYNIEY